MKEWYTNAEFAALNLPGFPATKPGVAAWFNKRDLDSRFPNKVRRRKGRGGGVERHLTLLPKPVQSYLTIRHLKSSETPAMPEPFEGAHEIPEPPAGERGEMRRDAILLLLNFWDIFRTRFNGPVETARHMFVTMYRNGKIDGIPDWVTEALKSETGRLRGTSVNTLRSWEEMRAEHKFSELAGNYGNRKGTGVLDTAEKGRVADLIAALLVKQPHLTADHIRDLVRDEFGETLEIGGKQKPVPSLRTFERFISTWRDAHQESLLKLTDPDAWKNKKRFSGTNMNHWVARPNQLWEIDASPADVLLTDGRYSIYAVIDIYTRRMMVTVTKTPKTAAVLALLRRAILAWGVPEILRTDNGSDFISHEFKRALSALAIHQDITDPFSPEQKGTVERAIGTVQRGLMPLLPGFVGHNVADRKKIEARKSFAQRLGESDEKAFCVELTHEELQSKVDHWLTAKYEHKAHGGLKGKTPFELVAAWTGKVRTIENERALDVMLAPIAGKDGFRTVTKFGIALDKAHFIHPALVPGDRVFCRHDPDDMGRIYVYSEDGHDFLCVAECPERIGVDPGEAVRAVREAQSQRIREEAEPLMRDIRAMKPRDMIDGVLRVADKDTASLTSFPKPTEAYTTPELDAATEVLKVAAGPKAPEARDFTDDEARMHDEIVADLSTESRKRVAPADDQDLDRFRYALELIETMREGKHVPSDEMRWLTDYQTTPEYLGLMKMYEDFGDRLFG